MPPLYGRPNRRTATFFPSKVNKFKHQTRVDLGGSKRESASAWFSVKTSPSFGTDIAPVSWNKMGYRRVPLAACLHWCQAQPLPVPGWDGVSWPSNFSAVHVAAKIGDATWHWGGVPAIDGMETMGNYGRLWETMGNYGKLWETMGNWLEFSSWHLKTGNPRIAWRTSAPQPKAAFQVTAIDILAEVGADLAFSPAWFATCEAWPQWGFRAPRCPNLHWCGSLVIYWNCAFLQSLLRLDLLDVFSASKRMRKSDAEANQVFKPSSFKFGIQWRWWVRRRSASNCQVAGPMEVDTHWLRPHLSHRQLPFFFERLVWFGFRAVSKIVVEWWFCR